MGCSVCGRLVTKNTVALTRNNGETKVLCVDCYIATLDGTPEEKFKAFRANQKRALGNLHESEDDKLDIFQLEPDVVVQTTVAELLDLYHQGLSHGAGDYQKDVTVRGEII